MQVQRRERVPYRRRYGIPCLQQVLDDHHFREPQRSVRGDSGRRPRDRRRLPEHHGRRVRHAGRSSVSRRVQRRHERVLLDSEDNEIRAAPACVVLQPRGPRCACWETCELYDLCKGPQADKRQIFERSPGNIRRV